MKKLFFVFSSLLLFAFISPVLAVEVSPIIYSQNGKSFAYEMISDAKHSVVLDGVSGALYEDVSNISFWGNSLIYTAKKDNSWFLVTNGNEGKKYDQILEFNLTEKNLSFTAKLNDKTFLSYNGTEFGPYDTVSMQYDGRNIISLATSDNKQFFIVNGQETKRYESTQGLIVFEDGKQLFAATDQGKTFLVINGKEGKRYDGLSSLTYISNSKNFRAVMFVNDIKGVPHYKIISINKEYPDQYDEVASFTGDSDYKNIYWTVKKGNKYYVLYNEKLSKAYDEIYNSTISLGPNNNYSFFGKRAGTWFSVLNNKELKIK